MYFSVNMAVILWGVFLEWSPNLGRDIYNTESESENPSHSSRVYPHLDHVEISGHGLRLILRHLADEPEELDTNLVFRRGERAGKQLEQHVQIGCPNGLFLSFSKRLRSNLAKLQSIYREISHSLFAISQEDVLCWENQQLCREPTLKHGDGRRAICVYHQWR